MSAEQVIGTASSYARKYALCGLLAIGDGSSDPDGLEPEKQVERQVENKKSRFEMIFEKALSRLSEAMDRGDNIEAVFENLKHKIRETDGEQGVEAVCLAMDKIK